jgi:hypothetical protein
MSVLLDHIYKITMDEKDEDNDELDDEDEDEEEELLIMKTSIIYMREYYV